MATINVAQYAVVPGSDTNRRIPDASGQNDHHYQDIQARNVDPNSRSVLFFKAQIETADLQLFIRLNSTRVVDRDFEFVSDVNAFSFHELIDQGVLKETNNELTVSVANGQGKVVISDIILLYRANLDV